MQRIDVKSVVLALALVAVRSARTFMANVFSRLHLQGNQFFVSDANNHRILIFNGS